MKTRTRRSSKKRYNQSKLGYRNKKNNRTRHNMRKKLKGG